MHQINLSNELYENAERRAKQAGFASVEDYVADVLAQDLQDETPDLDQFFTPSRLSLLQKADAQIDSGKFFSEEEADAELSNRRVEWLRQHRAEP